MRVLLIRIQLVVGDRPEKSVVRQLKKADVLLGNLFIDDFGQDRRPLQFSPWINDEPVIDIIRPSDVRLVNLAPPLRPARLEDDSDEILVGGFLNAVGLRRTR